MAFEPSNFTYAGYTNGHFHWWEYVTTTDSKSDVKSISYWPQNYSLFVKKGDAIKVTASDGTFVGVFRFPVVNNPPTQIFPEVLMET